MEVNTTPPESGLDLYAHVAAQDLPVAWVIYGAPHTDSGTSPAERYANALIMQARRKLGREYRGTASYYVFPLEADQSRFGLVVCKRGTGRAAMLKLLLDKLGEAG